MRIDDIQFRTAQARAELEEMKWRRKHLIERRSELSKRNAPRDMIRRYDEDLVDVINQIQLKQSELGDLEDRMRGLA